MLLCAMLTHTRTRTRINYSLNTCNSTLEMNQCFNVIAIQSNRIAHLLSSHSHTHKEARLLWCVCFVYRGNGLDVCAAMKQTSVCLFISRYIYLFRFILKWVASVFVFSWCVWCLSFECTIWVCNRMWIDWNFEMIVGLGRIGSSEWCYCHFYCVHLDCFASTFVRSFASNEYTRLSIWNGSGSETSLSVIVQQQQANINKPENWYQQPVNKLNHRLKQKMLRQQKIVHKLISNGKSEKRTWYNVYFVCIKRLNEREWSLAHRHTLLINLKIDIIFERQCILSRMNKIMPEHAINLKKNPVFISFWVPMKNEEERQSLTLK